MSHLNQGENTKGYKKKKKKFVKNVVFSIVYSMHLSLGLPYFEPLASTFSKQGL